MALSYVGYASAAANSVALPAFTVGDLALVFAYRDGSNTAPALPAGWTNIASSGANTNSSRVGRRVLQPGDTTTGAWTNATEVQVLVVRGQHLTSPIGAAGALPSGATASNRITYPTIQIFDDPVRSWIVGFCGHRTATNVNTGVIATFATRSAGSVTTSDGCHTRVNAFRHDIPADTYWFDTDGFDVNASAAWRSYMFELVEAAANQTQTAIAEVSLASGGVPTSRTAHSLHVRARKTNALDTGVMRLQLFEGATPRSAMLSTAALTTALADYAVNVADADAALIGSYTDLGVRFQGYSSEGTPTIFEVDQLWLETPEASAVVPPSAYPNVLMLAILPPDVVLGEPRIAAGGLVYLFGDSDLALPPPGTPRKSAGGLAYLFGDNDVVSPPASYSFGKTSDGVSATLATADHKFGTKYTLIEDGTVSKVSLRCCQSGDTGTVTARCSVYADNAGTPGALLGTTDEHEVTSGSYGWEDFTFTTPLVLSAGDYWLAFNTTHTGARLLAFRYDSVAGASRDNADTYAGGDSNPFGAASTDVWELCVNATYTTGATGGGGEPFPVSGLIDPFNRANETPLAAPWGKTRPSAPACILSANQVAWNAAYAHSYYGTVYGPDVEVYATVATAPTGTDGVSVTARIASPNTAGVDFYQGTYTNGVGWRIFRVVDDNYTQVGATAATPVLANGDSIGMEIVVDQIRLLHKTGGVWTAVKSETDATITAAGYIGVELAGASGRLDDFGGGTLGAIIPPPPENYPGDVTITFESYAQFSSALTGYFPGPAPRTQAHTQAQTFPIDNAVKRTGTASMQYISWAANNGGYDVDPGPPERMRVYQSPLRENDPGGMTRDPPNQEVYWAWSLRFPNTGTYCYTIPPDFASFHVSHPNYWTPMSFEPTGGLAALRMEIGGGRIVSPNEYPGLYGDFGGIAPASAPGIVALKANDPERRANGFQEFITLLGTGGVKPFTKLVWHDFIMRVRWNGYLNGILELRHREEGGSWDLIYSNVAGSGAMIQRAPHPTCVWNTQHGEQGETGRQYAPALTKVWVDYQMYRDPFGAEANVTWGLWCDNLIRRATLAEILAYLP